MSNTPENAANLGPYVTLARYVTAFETWRDAAFMSDLEREIVTSALRVLQATTPMPEQPRPMEVFCGSFRGYLHGRAGGEDGLPAEREACASLQLRIRKSCLLDRLLYVGEPLRTRKCPKHQGRWSGCPWPGAECPHGCTAACGCTTGWLPEAEVSL